MGTELWFRNADNYVKELVEAGSCKIAWDRGYLVKKKIDPHKFSGLYFGRAYPWESLVIGVQGTAHLNADHGMSKPLAVYPTWRYGDSGELLEEIIEYPVGEDEKICNDKSVPADERPVFGQQHMVVVTDLPNAASAQGRQFLRYAMELQQEFPNCKLHVHGMYSFKTTFGMEFRSSDYEPRSPAAKGKLSLPTGREMMHEIAGRHPQWLSVLGFKPADMLVPRNRCIYNIKSAEWAAENYAKVYSFRTTRTDYKEIDTETPDSQYVPPKGSNAVAKQLGDKFTCDTCSIQDTCKFYRAGAVCSVPGSEPVELSKFFKTRDSNTIIDGLGNLMALQTRRLERGLQQEEDFDEVNPEVSKLVSSVFEQGVKLAKLVNPELRGGIKVNVNTGGGAAAVAMGAPREMVASVVRALEEQGYTRDQITPELIQSVVEQNSGRPQLPSPPPIEGSRVINGESV